MNKENIVKVPVSKIKIDESIYPRHLSSVYLLKQDAYRYSEQMKAGQKFPPIVLGTLKNDKKKTLYLIDGLRRLEAQSVILKMEEVNAIINEYDSKLDMLLDAMNLNRHGTRLSIWDLARCDRLLIKYGVSLEQRCLTLGVLKEKYHDLIEARCKILEGKEIQLKSAVLDAIKKQRLPEDYIPENFDQTEIMTPNAKTALKQVIALFENECMPVLDKTIRSLCLKLYKILDELFKEEEK